MAFPSSIHHGTLFHFVNNSSMKINKEWHLGHIMPKNATLEQRIKWHVDHLKHCHCREDLPLKLKEEMKKRNIPIPDIHQ